VLDVRDAKGAIVLAIVLEVQRDEDPDKKYSWPVYVTVVRAKKRCGTVALVVAPDALVAAWAAQNIDLGLGCGNVKPLVLGPAAVPEITDPAIAEQQVELAVLSAVAHANGPNGFAVVQAALVALGRLDREHAAVYFQIIWNALSEPMRRTLEALVMERQTEGKATFPPFAQQLIDRGKTEGRAEEAARAVLTVLRVRGVAVPDAARERILAQKEPEQLERWLERAAVAPSVAEVIDKPS